MLYMIFVKLEQLFVPFCQHLDLYCFLPKLINRANLFIFPIGICLGVITIIKTSFYLFILNMV